MWLVLTFSSFINISDVNWYLSASACALSLARHISDYWDLSQMANTAHYRVTIHIVTNLPFTPKQRLRTCVLVHAPHTKTELLFWCIQEVGNNVNAHPACIDWLPSSHCILSLWPHCFFSERAILETNAAFLGRWYCCRKAKPVWKT